MLSNVRGLGKKAKKSLGCELFFFSTNVGKKETVFVICALDLIGGVL